MTKDTFLNSWSKELSHTSMLNGIEAKKFLREFYSAAIGFHKHMDKLK